MADRTTPHPHPTGYQLWHGAQAWEGPVEVRVSRKGSYKHGPGLYLTTSLDTAKSYAKGRGSLMEFELAPTTRWLEDSTLPVEAVRAFLQGRPGLRQRAAILADVEANWERARLRDPNTDVIRAPVLVNLCVNYEILSGDHGLALARFLVDHGIDASHAKDSYDECWVVLFNPEVVTRLQAHRVATVDPQADFPKLALQRQRWEHSPLSELTVPRPGVIPATRPRRRP